MQVTPGPTLPAKVQARLGELELQVLSLESALEQALDQIAELTTDMDRMEERLAAQKD